MCLRPLALYGLLRLQHLEGRHEGRRFHSVGLDSTLLPLPSGFSWNGGPVWHREAALAPVGCEGRLSVLGAFMRGVVRLLFRLEFRLVLAAARGSF